MIAFHHLVDQFAACIRLSLDSSSIYSTALLAGVSVLVVEAALNLAFEFIFEVE